MATEPTGAAPDSTRDPAPEAAEAAEATPVATAEPAAPSGGAVQRWLLADSRSRRLLYAAALYAICVGVFAALAGDRLTVHTPYNHFAHQADAWAHGHHEIVRGGPSYANGNDFADFEGKTFVSFPPFPAMLMLPLVAIAGAPENFLDGQFIVWLAGVGPAVLFLILEKLRRTGRSPRTEPENALFALLFAFGSIYCFTAVQGTVWFAGHVAGIAVLSLYVLWALDAESPFKAGLMLGCAFLTRPTMAPAALLFAWEAVRCALPSGTAADATGWGAVGRTVRSLDRARLLRDLSRFALPVATCLGFAAWFNHARFHTWNPSAFGHEYLAVGWQARILKWGLFSYHYLPKNLGAMLTILPWPRAPGAQGAAFQINEHGLALWFTCPVLLWLLRMPMRSARSGLLPAALLLASAGPFVLNLFYQNSGWSQFGYRFSNDYSVLWFVALSLTTPPAARAFQCAAVWSVAWNLFGAASFERAAFKPYYFSEPTQRVLYQED